MLGVINNNTGFVNSQEVNNNDDFSLRTRADNIVYLLKKHSTKSKLFKELTALFNEKKKHYSDTELEWDEDIRKQLKQLNKIKEDVLESEVNISLLKVLDDMIKDDGLNSLMYLKSFTNIVKETRKDAWVKSCNQCPNKIDLSRYNSRFKWSYRTRKLGAIKISNDVKKSCRMLTAMGYKFNMLTISPRNIKELSHYDILTYNSEILHYFFKHKLYTSVIEGQVMITEIKDHLKGEIKYYTKHWERPEYYKSTEMNYHNHLVIAYKEENLNEENKEQVQQTFRDLYELVIEKRIMSFTKKKIAEKTNIYNKKINSLMKFRKSYHITLSDNPKEQEVGGITKYLLHYVTKGIDVRPSSMKTLIKEFKGMKLYSTRGVFSRYKDLSSLADLKQDLDHHITDYKSLSSKEITINKYTTQNVLDETITIPYDINLPIDTNIKLLFSKDKEKDTRKETELSKLKRGSIRKMYYNVKHCCSCCGSRSMTVDQEDTIKELSTNQLLLLAEQQERTKTIQRSECERTQMILQ